MTVPYRRPRSVPLLTASVAGGLLLVLVVLTWTTPSASPANSPVAHPIPLPSPPPGALPSIVIIPAGMSYQLPAAAFEDVVFQLTMTASVSGAFSANGNVTAIILTTMEFVSFESTGSATGASWGSGPAPGGVLGVTLPAGTYYLVFANLEGHAPAMVHVVSGIQADFPAPA